MIVCLCRVVSEQAVRRSVQDGARTVREVGASCRAGTGCGACRAMIADLIREETGPEARDGADCQGHDQSRTTSPYLAKTGKAA